MQLNLGQHVKLTMTTLSIPKSSYQWLQWYMFSPNEVALEDWEKELVWNCSRGITVFPPEDVTFEKFTKIIIWSIFYRGKSHLFMDDVPLFDFGKSRLNRFHCFIVTHSSVKINIAEIKT